MSLSGAAWPAAIAGAGVALSAAGTGALIPLLRRHGVLDRPNARSSHALPTPRGGGLAPVATILLLWGGLAAAGRAAPAYALLLPGAALLTALSAVDDVRGLPPLPRLAVQFVAVACGLLALPRYAVFQGWLPAAIDAVASALFWVWWLNLFNFMDGIDGLAGSEAAAIGLGLVLLAGPPGMLPAAALAGAALGFLCWNWAPARVFLGDAGSIPLGYLSGWLLLDLAARGGWLVALVLPLYFLADASLTLARRLLRGEPIWQAHREHFYQRAVQRGLGHAAVVGRVVAADALLILCAAAAQRGAGLAALGAAAAVVAVLLAALARGR